MNGKLNCPSLNALALVQQLFSWIEALCGKRHGIDSASTVTAGELFPLDTLQKCPPSSEGEKCVGFAEPCNTLQIQINHFLTSLPEKNFSISSLVRHHPEYDRVGDDRDRRTPACVT